MEPSMHKPKQQQKPLNDCTAAHPSNWATFVVVGEGAPMSGPWGLGEDKRD
jgi:hypothetical protein